MAKYNDLDMKNWKDYKDIYTNSLWIINRRNDSGAFWKDIYPRAFW